MCRSYCVILVTYLVLVSSPVCCRCWAGWACRCSAAEPPRCCSPARIWRLARPETSWGSGGSCTGSPTVFGSRGWGPLSSAAAHTASPAGSNRKTHTWAKTSWHHSNWLFFFNAEHSACQCCLWTLWCPDLWAWARVTRGIRGKDIFVVIHANVSAKRAA